MLLGDGTGKSILWGELKQVWSSVKKTAYLMFYPLVKSHYYKIAGPPIREEHFVYGSDRVMGGAAPKKFKPCMNDLYADARVLTRERGAGSCLVLCGLGLVRFWCMLHSHHDDSRAFFGWGRADSDIQKEKIMQPV